MSDYDFDILRLGSQGYCCSQIIMQMALEMQGTENPGLIRALAGLCNGFAAAKGTCGALTGAVCLLAYFGGKGAAHETTHDALPLMLAELSGWFEEYAGQRFGGIDCAQIVGGTPDATVCGDLVGQCFGQAMRILVDNGFDPASDCHA